MKSSSKYIKNAKHGSRMREIITEAATSDKLRKRNRIDKYLDDMNLSNMNKLSEEGMRGFRD